MNELRVGIVGTGWVSDEYIRSFVLNPHTHIRGICSRNREKAERKIAEHGLMHCDAYTDYEKMATQSDIDIIAVLTPNFKHAEQTVIAAQEKKHIIIEKPLAINWEDMKKMQHSSIESS